MAFYLGLFIFIISVVTGLILLIAGKEVKKDKFILLATIHGILFFAFLASLVLKKDGSSPVNYYFLLFICSGVVLCGLAWKSGIPMPVKIYFIVFALTIPIFLISPSYLMNFLLTASFQKSGEQLIQVTGRYYLERQSVTGKKKEGEYYKLIQKKGIFHSTISRDLNFNGKIDSIKVVEFNTGQNILIRGYTGNQTYVSTEVDSLDVSVPLKVVKSGSIEYRVQ